MGRVRILERVAAVDAALVLALALAFELTGRPVRGVLLGGGLMIFSFVTFWTVATSITRERRRGLAILLGMTKTLLFLVLGGAVLSGRLTADPLGFALGVTAFVVAVVAVAATRPQTASWAPAGEG
jgi:amino acid transporter